MAGFAPKPKNPKALELARYAGHLDTATARAELAALLGLYRDGLRQPLAYHPDLDDSYDPAQPKAFDNVSFRFKTEAHPKQRHHLNDDPYFALLLGDDGAPLGLDAERSPFIRAIEAATGPMNRVLRPVDGKP
jgi:exodeoxyribonuclease V gamma subunit